MPCDLVVGAICRTGYHLNGFGRAISTEGGDIFFRLAASSGVVHGPGDFIPLVTALSKETRLDCLYIDASIEGALAGAEFSDVVLDGSAGLKDFRLEGMSSTVMVCVAKMLEQRGVAGCPMLFFVSGLDKTGSTELVPGIEMHWIPQPLSRSLTHIGRRVRRLAEQSEAVRRRLRESAVSDWFVFISHAGENRSVYDIIRVALEESRFHVWPREGLAGEELDSFVARGIDECDAIVLLLSAHHVAKRWPRREYELVIKRVSQGGAGRPVVIPVLLGLNEEDFKRNYPELKGNVHVTFDEHDLEGSVIRIREELERWRLLPTLSKRQVVCQL